MPEVTLPSGDSIVRVDLPERAVIVGGGDGGTPRLPPLADERQR